MWFRWGWRCGGFNYLILGPFDDSRDIVSHLSDCDPHLPMYTRLDLFLFFCFVLPPCGRIKHLNVEAAVSEVLVSATAMEDRLGLFTVRGVLSIWGVNVFSWT